MQLFISKIEENIYLYTAHVSHILLFALNYVYVLCLYMNVYVIAAAYEGQKRVLSPLGVGVSGNKCVGNRTWKSRNVLNRAVIRPVPHFS